MIRKFLKDAAVLTFANVTTRLMGLIMFPIYARYLLPEDFGLFDFLLLIGTILIIVFSLESHQGLLRLIPTHSSVDGKRALCSSVLVFNIAAMGIVCTTIAVVGYVNDGRMFGIENSPAIIATAAGGWFLLAVNQQLLAMRRAALDTPAIALASILGMVASVATGIVLIVWLRQGALGLILSAAAGSAMSVLVLWLRSLDQLRVTLQAAALREVFRFSLPLTVSSLGAVGWLFTDRYIAKEFLGLHEVGLLGVAYRFGAVIALMTGVIGMALNPLIYSLHDEPGTARDIARLFHYFVAAGAMIVACFAGYAEVVLDLLAPDAYAGAAPLLPLVAAVLFLSAGYQFFPGLMLAKRTAAFGAIQLAGLALNVALSVLLVTRAGVIGVCIASLITASVVLAAIYGTGQASYRVQCEWSKVFMVSGVTGVLVGLLTLHGYEGTGIRWAGYALPAIVALLIVATGLVPRGDVTALLMRAKSAD